MKDESGTRPVGVYFFHLSSFAKIFHPSSFILGDLGHRRSAKHCLVPLAPSSFILHPSSVMKTLPDNLCRWDGRARGHYEVWYFTMNQRASGCGFWFRYTLEISQTAGRPAHSELWAFFLDPQQPNAHVALKASYPIENFTAGNGREYIARIDRHAFGADYLRGSLVNAGHEIGWDLQFQPSPTTYQHVPAFLRTVVPLKTLVCS